MEELFGKDSKWISYSDSTNDEEKIYYFRKKFFNNSKSPKLLARVSADSRYKLYLNGKIVSIGPCKGNIWTTYFEKVDLSGYVKDGLNVLAAEVLHFKEYEPYGIQNISLCAVNRTVSTAFLLDGVLVDMDGNIIEDISTDDTWKTAQEDGVNFIPPVYSMFTSTFQNISAQKVINGWKNYDFIDDSWRYARVLGSSHIKDKSSDDYGQLTGWVLEERPIPQLNRIDRNYKSVTNTNYDREKIERLINGGGEINFLPGTSSFFEIDAGELTTGYINLITNGGRGSTVKILYSECYEEYKDGKYKKGTRDNANGVLRGDFDIISPDGRDFSFETFWFRSFRFVRVEISTGEQELTLKKLDYKETGYPLEIGGKFESSDETHSKLWDISVRTLKRCMHETYEDCPYYEQLQYTMDSRLEMLFSYQISKDDRLARKCINDFHSSLNPDGLLQARYPSVIRQIIPGFCLHWIYMLRDYIMYFDDKKFIKKYRPTVDAVLGWFDRNITNEGLVGKTGYWSFVDWVKGWDIVSVPTANRRGPITVYSLMYAKALQDAALLNKETGRIGISDEYLSRSSNIINAVRKYCYDDEKKLFTDGPGVSEFSQHAQVWAVLAGAAKGTEAEELLTRALDSDISRVSYTMSFYLFRALEKAGLYDKVDTLLNSWRRLADMNLTTWVEDPVTQRSDCHGWGSLPLYEFPAVILGVRPADTGYRKIRINPYIGTLKHAEGTVCTKNGFVNVEWRIKDKEFSITILSPEGIEKEIVLPDGKTYKMMESNIRLSCQCK